MNLSHRAAGLHTTVDRYPQLFARREGIINLGPGDPDFGTPDHIGQAVIDALAAGYTRYTSVNGIRELREAIAESLFDMHGVSYSPDAICVMNGSKQALANALLATVDNGDEVILIAPFYPVYYQMVRLAGGIPCVAPSSPENRYELPVAAIRARLSSRTRWVVINSPNNPSGRVYSRAVLQELSMVMAGHPRTGVLSDQIYERLTFDGAIAPSIMSVSPEARERGVLVSGVSKAYSMTGFRIGYAAGDLRLIQAMARIQYVTTSCASSLGQHAALAAIRGPQDSVLLNAGRLRALIKFARDAISADPRLSAPMPEAGLYLLVGCSALMGARDPSGRRIGSDLDLAGYLVDEAGVQVMPGTIFGLPGNIRITCAVDQPVLSEGMSRICRALSKLS